MVLNKLWKGFLISFFDKKAIKDVAKDKKVTVLATVVLVGAILFDLIVTLINDNYAIGEFFYDFITYGLIYSALAILLVHVIASKMKDKKKLMEFYRPYALSTVISFLFVIAGIFMSEIVAGYFWTFTLIWNAIILYFIVRTVYGASVLKSLGIVVLSFLFLIVFIVFAETGAELLGLRVFWLV